MMPLTFADVEEDNIIKRIGGTPEVKKHLENLGFVVGGNVIGFILGLAVVAFGVYMLVRKQKEA